MKECLIAVSFSMVNVNIESCSIHMMLKQDIGFVEVGVEMHLLSTVWEWKPVLHFEI